MRFDHPVSRNSLRVIEFLETRGGKLPDRLEKSWVNILALKSDRSSLASPRISPLVPLGFVSAQGLIHEVLNPDFIVLAPCLRGLVLALALLLQSHDSA